MQMLLFLQVIYHTIKTIQCLIAKKNLFVSMIVMNRYFYRRGYGKFLILPGRFNFPSLATVLYGNGFGKLFLKNGQYLADSGSREFILSHL
jgi:hypothetical protein